VNYSVKLLNQVREVIRKKHYSIRTERYMKTGLKDKHVNRISLLVHTYLREPKLFGSGCKPEPATDGFKKI